MIKRLKERIKEFTNDTYGMLIFVSWIVLIACLIIKIFGGNWFELETENSKFIQFCIYVDNTMWLKMLLACIISLISGYISLCVMLNEKRLSLKNVLIFIPLMIIKSIISWYSSVISFVLDIFIMLGLTTIRNKSFKRSILCFVMITLFQLITLFFRNISGNFTLENSFLIQALYQIDYYLMLLLFYLYNFKRKEIQYWVGYF